MKLRSKLLLGFSGVVAIILAMGVVMILALNQIGDQSKSVDSVDSALAQALIGRGHVLRFLKDQNAAYLSQANEAFAESRRLFNVAEPYLSEEHKKTLAESSNSVAEVAKLFSQAVAFDKKSTEIDAQLQPLTSKLTEALQQLRGNILERLETQYSKALMGFYGNTIEIGELFRNARLAARMYVARPTPENERKALEALKLTSEGIKVLDGKASEPRNAQLVKELLSVAENYERLFRDLISSIKDLSRIDGLMQQQFTSITKTSVDLSARVTADLLSNASMSRNTMFAGTSIVMLLCIVIALFLTANVLRQLGKDPGILADLAQRVTKGDFDIDDGSPRLGVYGNLVAMVAALKDNIAKAKAESERAHEQTQKAQEAMSTAEKASNEAQAKASSLLEAADRLESVANVVSSASEELSAQIEQSERGAAEQASRVAETATAMEEMNSTVLEVARNASAAADVSTSTRQKAEAGAEIVNKVVNSIQEVQKQSGHLKTDMTTLDENAKSITQIMGVISDIADQTNLLALNAAIEAARAGEAGRGFAVVADEVRKLAEKTMASTTDVGNAIRSIQASVNQSISQVDTSVTIIEQATEYAKQSGVALNEIVTMVDSTADQVRAIATASEQQSSTSDEINRSINHVNGIASETARAMQESAQAVSELANQAQVLSQLIDNMKRG